MSHSLDFPGKFIQSPLHRKQSISRCSWLNCVDFFFGSTLYKIEHFEENTGSEMVMLLLNVLNGEFFAGYSSEMSD